VVRLDLGRKILFVGDAKETETPGSWATRQRLGRYATAVAPAALAGADVIFAVAHPSSMTGKQWTRLLTDVIGSAGLIPLSKSSCILYRGTTVTAVVAAASPGRAVSKGGYVHGYGAPTAIPWSTA
jgi:hypothetical protein